MHRADERLSRLEKMMDHIIEKNPPIKDIVNAFRPVMVERNRLIETLELTPGDSAEMDRTRLKRGVPVIEQTSLFQPDDPWEKIATSLIPAFMKGFPTLKDDLEKLQTPINNKTVELYDYFKALPDGGDKITDGWSKGLNIQPTTLFLFLRTVRWVVLHKRERAAASQLGEFDWEKGYCPICGSFPSISIIKEKSAERWLHCRQCGHDWRFSRVICPYCDHRGQKGMTFFFVEDRKQESVFTCDQCKRYLVTLNQVSDIREMDLDISALGLAHLDILMQDKGFVPMVQTEWNLS